MNHRGVHVCNKSMTSFQVEKGAEGQGFIRGSRACPMESFERNKNGSEKKIHTV